MCSCLQARLEAEKAALEGSAAGLEAAKAALEAEKAALEAAKAALEAEKQGLESERDGLLAEKVRTACSPAIGSQGNSIISMKYLPGEATAVQDVGMGGSSALHIL